MTARHPNGFRFSDEFIKKWTNALIITLFVVTGVGVALGLASDADAAPSWLGEAAVVVIVIGVVGPILASAVLGGEAIRKGGGVIGLLFTAGFVAGGAGKGFEIPWLMWTGGVVAALGVLSFWVIGWIAKVPMYIGLPRAHGKVIQRKDSPPRDYFGGDDPRLRVKRPRRGSGGSRRR
ncbi:hypothetical protein [Aeromicrobium chenweiae]|uniref:Uncharacterized protein n=1 Tax=Aeromicrobium chenweiae TaxID=2079793 RepID=A0A2S0WQA3_9ACTN|nr:hypothetical protein [Aeromicrobium chenweiae]AWB93438.1 hypothetical protein C3E78_15135 [Aeromicrobium chenweiae]TGN34430.1 hypothetical protein E4L97_05155 [Aeromicrobium chenweiae]